MLDHLRDVFQDTIQIAQPTGFDIYGRPTGSTPLSVRARVVIRQRLVRVSSGELERSAGHAWLATTLTFDTTAVLTLPSGATARILAIESHPDESGKNYCKVYFT